MKLGYQIHLVNTIANHEAHVLSRFGLQNQLHKNIKLGSGISFIVGDCVGKGVRGVVFARADVLLYYQWN